MAADNTHGWKAGSYGRCWLSTCKGTGYRKEVNGYELVLCPVHIGLLEQSNWAGYSNADPPPCGGWWPWKLVGA